MNQKTIGVLCVLGASIMWAIEPIFAKLSYYNADFVQTTTIRVVFVVLISFAYAFVTNRRNFKVNRKQFLSLAYIAIAASVFAELLYFYAIGRLPVVNVVLIGHLQPIFVVFIGYLAFKEEKLTWLDYLGITFMMIAGLLVSTRTIENLKAMHFGTFADLLVLISTIIWATTAIVARKYIRDLNSGVIVFYRFSIALIPLAAYLYLASALRISNIYQVFVGIAVGLGTLLYYEGLKRLKAAQVGALELSTPFFAAILGFFVLGEVTTFMQIFGIGLLFAGVYFLSKKE
ncbi:DMT family transporter [Candidatus Woesearchaeota archaeon]|nr:DMT family transporter [Candidatus Woesearchaeota archaeon]